MRRRKLVNGPPHLLTSHVQASVHRHCLRRGSARHLRLRTLQRASVLDIDVRDVIPCIQVHPCVPRREGTPAIVLTEQVDNAEACAPARATRCSLEPDSSLAYITWRSLRCCR